MTPEDILNAEFSEQNLGKLQIAFARLPYATHVLWGLSYWLADQGDQTGAGMVSEWARDFAEHEARRQTRLASYGRTEPAPVAPAARRRSSLNLADCSLEEFADAVLAAARSAREGRWHGSVFIVSVWNELERDGDPGISYTAFKRRIMQAFQEDLLELSRADLVEAMSPDLVRDSELTHSGARFHFVRI